MAEGARFCASCGTPVTASAESHPTEFHIVGDVMQAVVIPLRGGQEVQAEPGALLYMAGDVEMDSQMKGGLWGGIRRMVAGESLFMTRFRSRVNGQVAAFLSARGTHPWSDQGRLRRGLRRGGHAARPREHPRRRLAN